MSHAEKAKRDVRRRALDRLEEYIRAKKRVWDKYYDLEELRKPENAEDARKNRKLQHKFILREKKDIRDRILKDEMGSWELDKRLDKLRRTEEKLDDLIKKNTH